MSRKPLSVQAQQDRLRRKRREAGEVLTIFRKPLKESLTSVLPITAIVLVLCFTITPISNNAMMAFLLGSLLLIVGMGLFTLGSEMSMIPLGEAVGKEITRSKKVWVIVAISFLIGVIITVAEPDLQVLAGQVPSIPDRVIPLDVAGVAIATSVSQLLSAVLVTVRLCTFRGPCRLDLRKIRLYPDRTGQMLRLGFSAGLQGVIFSASNVMIQSAINSFGSVVMAGSSAASGIENFIHTALNTFYQSAITFTGQSIGASDPRRAVRVFRINLALTTGLGIVLCALAQIFQIPLLGLYVQSTDPAYDAVIAAGVVRVLALSRFQWVGGLMETACGTLRGLGHSMNPTVTTLIGACLLRVVWRYTVFEAVGTVESMYWSYPVSWLLTFLIHLIYLERDRRRLMAENTAAQ